MMTVADLIALLSDLPEHHEVRVDALNGSSPRGVVAVSQRSNVEGPYVVVW